MDRCTGLRDIAEITLKTAVNAIQSINQSNFSQRDITAIMPILARENPELLYGSVVRSSTLNPLADETF